MLELLERERGAKSCDVGVYSAVTCKVPLSPVPQRSAAALASPPISTASALTLFLGVCLLPDPPHPRGTTSRFEGGQTSSARGVGPWGSGITAAGWEGEFQFFTPPNAA